MERSWGCSPHCNDQLDPATKILLKGVSLRTFFPLYLTLGIEDGASSEKNLVCSESIWQRTRFPLRFVKIWVPVAY